ncbi:hypothetical protein PsorP6_000502 [Peronosclerospora sorghi]|uniref:Uncharacterized protein n=1 Tax=Peronosclerospora sorghi TaxID=230839 RepID=A0ACC0WSX8_9STRA|nr:hypothetical protein PsorP6_000502 [Peronosclerospora sorghi]
MVLDDNTSNKILRSGFRWSYWNTTIKISSHSRDSEVTETGDGSSSHPSLKGITVCSYFAWSSAIRHDHKIRGGDYSHDTKFGLHALEDTLYHPYGQIKFENRSVIILIQPNEILQECKMGSHLASNPDARSEMNIPSIHCEALLNHALVQKEYSSSVERVQGS